MYMQILKMAVVCLNKRVFYLFSTVTMSILLNISDMFYANENKAGKHSFIDFAEIQTNS